MFFGSNFTLRLSGCCHRETSCSGGFIRLRLMLPTIFHVWILVTSQNIGRALRLINCGEILNCLCIWPKIVIWNTSIVWKVKVKQSNYRPGQSLSVPGGWGSQISRQSAHEGGKVVSPTHRPPLPPGNIPGTHFCSRLSRPEGHSAAGRILSMKKNPVTPSGIEPATFWAVAQCLNQLRHRVPTIMCHLETLIVVWTIKITCNCSHTPFCNNKS